MSTFAGHFTDPPRDGTGQPVPNATFQLYIPGTKTQPTYYTNRTKGGTVAGDPRTDSFGNCDIWPEAGVYEYWFDGRFIQLVTVIEDNGEDNADLATAVAAINATLGNYYTKLETDAAISSGGGPVVGGELQANKGVANGYAGLDGSGLVPDAQLPSALERTTNKNQNNGYAGLNGSGKVAAAQLDVGALNGGHVVTKTTTYTAAPGDFIVADTSGGTFTITLPTPANDQGPISVKLKGTTSVSVTGNIDGSSQTITFAVDKGVHRFVSDGSTWWIAGAYIPLSIFARLDADNDFGNHQITNYKDKVVTVTTSTYTAGTDGWGIRIRWTNSGGGTLTLPNNAAIGDWIILHQSAAGQVSISSASGASFSEPDSYSKTAKQTAAVLITCIRNDTTTSAVYVVGEYTGP
jgi:hypothetical protein